MSKSIMVIVMRKQKEAFSILTDKQIDDIKISLDKGVRKRK